MAGCLRRVPDVAKLPSVFSGIAYTTILNFYRWMYDLKKETHLHGGADSEFWGTCVKFSRWHVAELKRSRGLSTWADGPVGAAGEAGPRLCWYFGWGWLFGRERKRRDVKKMVERMKGKGVERRRCEDARKEQWEKNQSCQGTAEAV